MEKPKTINVTPITHKYNERNKTNSRKRNDGLERHIPIAQNTKMVKSKD